MVSSNNISKQNGSGVKATKTPKKCRAVPLQTRERIIDLTLRKDTKSVSSVAKLLGIPRSTVDNIRDRFVETGEIAPRPKGGRKAECVKLTDEHSQYLIEILDEDCTLTLEMMRERLYERFPDLREKTISCSGIYRHITDHIGFTLKKTKPVEEKRNSPEVIAARKKFVESLQSLGISYKTNCIFVDEAGFNANLIRQRGWARKGEDAVVQTVTKRAVNISILASISYNGVENISAKLVMGGTTSDIFIEYMKILVAKLDETNAPPHWFIMDNAGIHRAGNVYDYIMTTRHRIHYLPAWSPFLNPVEECFGKLKGLARRKPGLSTDAFLKHIGESSLQITKENCQGWINHSISYFQDCLESRRIE